MKTDQEKLDILEKVLSSEEFSHSKKTQGLLKFLVDASIENKDLNEIIIATEFFSKDSNFDPLEDASIRVYISQLRKRLVNYYLREGENDKILIEIPKGNYFVQFRKKNTNFFSLAKKNISKVIFPSLTLLLSIIIIYFVIQNQHLNEKFQVMPTDNPIWAEYLEDSRPILVVLGDYFFMYNDRGDELPRLNVRDPLINSLEEFHEYNEKNPSATGNFEPLEHTYLRPSAVWGFMDMQPILRSAKSSFLVKQASEIVWGDVSSHNVIFIGTFKQMYLLKTFLEKMNAEFSLHPNILYLDNKNGEEKQVFKSSLDPETRQYSDVCLLAKFSGPNNNTIMLITGFHEGGVIYGSKAISDPDFPKEALKDYDKELQKPFHFKSVLKVEGFRHTELSSKIEYFDIIK